jgi:hypothetical protein
MSALRDANVVVLRSSTEGATTRGHLVRIADLIQVGLFAR